MNNRKHPLPGSTLSRLAGGVLILVPFCRGLLVKRRVYEIQVLLIHLLLCQPQPLTEALEMDDLAFSEETNRFADIWIRHDTKDVVVGAPGFLFWGDLVSTTYTKI